MRALPTRMQDNLYHDMFFPEETLEIRKKVREFAERVVAPRAAEIAQQEESVDTFPWDMFNKMAEEGLYKIPFPSEYGGLGLKYPTCATVVALEELAYVSNSVAAIYDVHCILSGNSIMYGTDDLKKKYLTPMIEGKIVGCFATTEPDASSDLSLRAMQSVGRKDGDTYIINGHKRFITNGPVANQVSALFNIDGKLTELVIELKQPGVRVGDPDLKCGNRGQLTCDLYFDNVVVPEENRIGNDGNGLHVALGTLTYGRIGIGACGVGMAQSAFDECVEYMKKREAFGKKLSQMQYWQYKWAERAIQIENARNLYIKAAYLKDTGVEFPEPVSAGAKYYGTEIAGDLARDAVQIFGGYGWMRKLAHDDSTYKVEEIYRDYKITEIYEGTNEVQKMIIARSIFGRDSMN
ncbi:MAG: acyl-CoA dehydrogenase family protein [Deltaproteobacteria bacterium]|nr:acyl-CoA dehydrogenase family protein [Deltaproteobacteria bacterium]